MRKNLLVMMVMLGLVMVSTSVSYAQSKVDFLVTAEIPAASSVSFNVASVNPGPPITFTPIATTSLNFDMALNASLGIYLPTSFFAIDVAPTGGAGTPDVQIEYTDTNNPNSSIGKNGLAAKGVATVVQVVGGPAPSDQSENPLEKETLGGINGTTISAATISGGFMRLYLGIATGEVGVDPAGAEVFTNSDNPGSYEGTLTLTATLP